MARGDFPRPAPLDEEAFYRARATRVTFVNPHGYEHYADVKGFGRQYDKFFDEHYDRNKVYGPHHEQRAKRFGTQGPKDGFAPQNRPVK